MTDNDLNGFQETGVGMYDTYIPFQTGWTIDEYRANKCEYCGKPATTSIVDPISKILMNGIQQN